MRKKENCDVRLMSGGRVGCWSVGHRLVILFSPTGHSVAASRGGPAAIGWTLRKSCSLWPLFCKSTAGQ